MGQGGLLIGSSGCGVLRATARGGTLVQVGNLPGTAVPAVLVDLITREMAGIGAYRFVDEITVALVALRDVLMVEQAADGSSGSSKAMLRLDASRNLA